jgi:hypothetical protein
MKKFSHGYAVGLMLLAITNLMIPAGFYMITLQRGHWLAGALLRERITMLNDAWQVLSSRLQRTPSPSEFNNYLTQSEVPWRADVTLDNGTYFAKIPSVTQTQARYLTDYFKVIPLDNAIRVELLTRPDIVKY